MTAPRLSPFPIATPDTLVDVTLDDWIGNGWVEDTDFIYPDNWGENGAFAASMLAESPPTHFDQLVKTFDASDGLQPNTLYRVAIGCRWSIGVGAPGGPGPTVTGLFYGAWVNDVFQQLPGPFFFSENPGTLSFMARANDDAEIEVRVGAIGMVGSFDIVGSFDRVTITSLAAELRDIFYDAGVLYVNGSAFSITRGGHAFDPGEVWEDYEFPGKRAPVEGLDELVSCRPVIRTRCMLTGEYQMTVYRPDGTWSDHATIDGARTYTPADLGVVLGASKYLQDVIVVWPRSRGDYLAVHFPRAINRKYGFSSADKDEGQIDVEFEARIPSGEPLTTVPYQIHTYPAGTAQAA